MEHLKYLGGDALAGQVDSLFFKVLRDRSGQQKRVQLLNLLVPELDGSRRVEPLLLPENTEPSLLQPGSFVLLPVTLYYSASSQQLRRLFRDDLHPFEAPQITTAFGCPAPSYHPHPVNRRLTP